MIQTSGALPAQQTASVTVEPSNRAPEAIGSMPGQAITVGQTAGVDVASYFRDPDGDALSYEAVSADVDVATVSVSGSTVAVAAVAAGNSTVTVTASDPGGLEAHQEWAVTVTPSADRAALVAFYEAAGGDNWDSNRNWLTEAPLRDWHGVQVNSSGRVVSLVLVENNLKGRIAPEIGDLSSLETLILRRNRPLHGGELTGPIPPEIGNLSKLSDLRLSSNELTGRIPAELGRLANLGRLDLHLNDITGRIPAALGQLTNLDRLDLGDNEVTGSIPVELTELDLTYLDLARNNLTGRIPAELC